MCATIEAIRQFDLEIEKLCADDPDFPLFQSLPGAGEVHFTIVGGDGHATRPLDHSRRVRLFVWHRSSDGAQWSVSMDSLALLLSQVHASVPRYPQNTTVIVYIDKTGLNTPSGFSDLEKQYYDQRLPAV